MNEHELRSIFPGISADALRRNVDIQNRDAGKAPVVERNPRDGALGAQKVQRPTGRRFFLRVTSVRRRLLDQSNLCYKYHEDLLRYAGILPDDSPGICQSEVRQRKAYKDEAEHIVIEVYEMPLDYDFDAAPAVAGGTGAPTAT